MVEILGKIGIALYARIILLTASMTSFANSLTLLVTLPTILMIPAIVAPTDLIAPTKAVS